jgi:tetratricopeptide (TPR) repeat protein
MPQAPLLYSWSQGTSSMGILLRRGSWPLLLIVWVGLFSTAHAVCTGPEALTANLRAHPTTANAIQLGGWFASHKQFQCAVETFRAALKTDPGSAQLNYLEGLALVGAGQPEAAIPALQEAIRLQPDVIKPHLLLATVEEHSGNIDKAEAEWRKALAIDPHSEIALEGLSGELLAGKDYIGVVGLLQHAPRTETLTLHLAEALEALNYIDGANDVLLEAMKLAPDSLPLANAESVVLIKKRSYTEAVKLLGYTTAHHPGNRAAELQFLRILVLTQHNDLARPLGVKLLAQTPHDWEVLYLNGVLEHAVGDLPNAKAHLQESVTLTPEFAYSRYYLGVTFVALHEWKDAKENLDKAIALGYTDSKAHYELALALHGLGETDRAAQELQQYQDLKKGEEDDLEAASLAAQADGELAAGKLPEAIAHYRQACDKFPGKATYKYELAMAFHKSGDLESERAQLEAAVKLDPHHSAAQKELGYLLARSGDAAGAVEHFQMAVDAAPTWVDAWINLAAELAVEAHFPEARKAVEMALRLDPDNPQARKLNNQLSQDPAAQQGQP